MFAIAQRATERGDPMCDQLGIARYAHGVGHGEAVGHASGVHGFGLGIGWQLALIVQVAKAFRQAGGLGE